MSKLSIIYTRAQSGIRAPLVTVETHISRGIPSLSIVGLPETAVKESKDRVRSAILNSNYEFPTSKIIINLAPADLPKEGGRYDLPIAIGILAATGQIQNFSYDEYEFAGELALTGDLRAINGIIPLALGARADERKLILPICCANEAALPGDNIILGAMCLRDVIEHLNDIKLIPTAKHVPIQSKESEDFKLDVADINGQPHAKRALEICAAGNHSLLLIGPPGTGKTMLASRLPTIMPKLSLDQCLEVAAVYSVHKKQLNFDYKRPFRNPHHTSSAVALVGGGSKPKPGEISLAHHGVLFLDELPEFDRHVLESLREPLESGNIMISRAAKSIEYPAKFLFIAAMNPCPCGNFGNPRAACNCTEEQIRRYSNKISGPLMDRIDLHVQMPLLPINVLTDAPKVKTVDSNTLRTQVERVQQLQFDRFNKLNANLNNNEIKKLCVLKHESKELLTKAVDSLKLSARSYYKILKVARTIADLADAANIEVEHVREAISYRKADLGE